MQLDLSGLSVAGLAAVCDIDDTPTANTRPNISVKITQCIILSDGSMIPIDMDRGFTESWHGPREAVSWKRSADALVAEILNLVQADDGDVSDSHPWRALAEASRRIGIAIDAAQLRNLPYRVLLSDRVIRTFDL